MRFFSYDSKFSQILLKLSASCYLNLLWMLCSLPVFTLGASTTALYSVTLKLARGEDPALTRDFFRAFRRNFRQATLLWLLLLAVGLLLAADGYVLYHLSRSASQPMAIVWTLLLAVLIVSAIAYTIVLIHIFPLVATFENTSRAMLKNAFLIGIRYLFCSISVFAIHFAMFFVVVAVFTPLFLFGEGLCALLSAYLLSPVLRQCEPPEEALP